MSHTARRWSACAPILGLCLLLTACGESSTAGPDKGTAARDGSVAQQDKGNGDLGPLADQATSDQTVGDGTTPTFDGPITCFNKCTDGVSQCMGSQIQTCQVQSSGCTDWNAPGDCPDGKACNGGACPTCTDDCTFGNTQCSGTQVEKCILGSSGCYTWGPAADCPGGLDCSMGACPTCINQCTADATQCLGSQIQTCAVQSNGCTDWGAPVNCAGGNPCTQNVCPTCNNECTPSTTQCDGDQIQLCELEADGCTHWQSPEDCPGTATCQGDACPTCTNQCTAGLTRCAGNQFETCAVQSSGCTDWNAPADCPSGACSNDQCEMTCSEGDRQCNGQALEVCNSGHQWQLQQLCAQSCDPTTLQCLTDVTCVAGTRRCNNNLTQVCNASGTAWLTAETCAFGCADGLCTGACTPGNRRCNGSTPEECAAGGASWTQEAACTTFCYHGACAEPTLTVDADANRELDGELVYAGDVVIKNSSVVSVPTGRLVIRARRFVLDASSSITVAATGEDPRGAGLSGATKTCSNCCTATGTTGGSGGGHGTPGGTASHSISCYASYCGSRSCTISQNGGPAFSIADDEANAGSRGGSCSGDEGGMGGGYIAIYAEEILIAGAISANGDSGPGCAGGGSGGSIVLRATDSLEVSGGLSAMGGVGGNYAGNGGQGAVRLLYGNANDITGTVSGKLYSSYMPPDDLSSSTHPDPTLWYNDDFPALELAWSNPFSQSGGYYTKLNTSYDFVPGPANSIYQTGETLQHDSADLIQGANYIHVSVVGPTFDPSSIQSHFRVQVNTTPPTISSQSHSSSSTWYDNYTAFLQWTLPRTDENTARFYWILDRFAQTRPDKSANTIPMNLADPDSSKRLLLPINAAGIWFFHLIAEDTAGYLTTGHRSFRLQVGTDPGQGGLSGTITDASSGGFLEGVNVTLNRGVHLTSSDSQGAYAFTNNTVSAQEYEVRATKEGYLPGTQTVTVTAGSTATVNLSLTPE